MASRMDRSDARQEQFEHHVVRQQDLRRFFAHALTRLFLLLASILAERNGKLSSPRFVVGLVPMKFF